MVRRHEQLAFMGGAHVFPGGRVDATDKGPDDPDGFRLAALRELFEEGGVLLASHADGRPLSFADPAIRQRFAAHRQTALAHAGAFRDIVAHEHLRLDLERLLLFAEWVTPPRLPRRFDTRFFAARAPEAQDALHDSGETIESLWITPADALARAAGGVIELPPPTRHTLEELIGAHSVDEALARYRARTPPRFEPQ
jgi:8-oxo-dGTP pyrophosphatase MutT (NUDIX family)